MIDIVSASATVIATLLAIIAIVWSVQQSRANADAIKEARYSSIQIGLLTEVLDLLNEGRRDHRPLERWRAIHSRLRVLDEPLNRVRIVFGVGYSDDEKLSMLGYEREQLKAVNDNFEELPRPGGGRERDTLFDQVVISIARTGRASSNELIAARSSADARRTEDLARMQVLRDSNGGWFE